jgi:hypothetical protein
VDATGDVLFYSDLTVGRQLNPMEMEMTPALVASYLTACGIAIDRSPYAGVPPLLAAAAGRLRATLPGRIPDGSLHVRDELDIHRIAAVGERLSTRTWIGDRYERRGRKYIVFAQEVTDQSGRVLVAGRRTNLWGA